MDLRFVLKSRFECLRCVSLERMLNSIAFFGRSGDNAPIQFLPLLIRKSLPPLGSYCGIDDVLSFDEFNTSGLAAFLLISFIDKILNAFITRIVDAFGSDCLSIQLPGNP
jgi:hypothetical protein